MFKLDPPGQPKGTWAICNSDKEHVYTSNNTKQRPGLHEKVKQMIIEFESQVMMPKRMITLLRAKGENPPPNSKSTRS